MENSLTCSECGAPLGSSERRSLPYNCGLPGIVLHNVEVHACTRCDSYEVDIPRVLELHRSLARAVASQPDRMSGKEIRFLRKHLNWTAAEMAEHFDVAPETVSRWENDRQLMGSTAERLLRILAIEGPEFASTAPLRFSGTTSSHPVSLTIAESGWLTQ